MAMATMGVLVFNFVIFTTVWHVGALRTRSRFLPKCWRLYWPLLFPVACFIGAKGALLGLLFLGFVFFWEVWERSHRRTQAERQELIFFRTLTGLMQGGMSLPAAFWLLSPGKSSLRGFWKEGRPLPSTFPQTSPSCQLGWEALEFVYARGLSGADLLSRLVPILEERARLQARVGLLKKRALVQWGFAACVPWGLLAVWRYFSPDAAAALHPGLVVGAIFYQAVGGYLAWRVSCFQ